MVSVIGEALIDLVQQSKRDGGPSGADAAPTFRALPGGSPFNVAIGLARLGQPATLQARLGRDAFGRQLRAHAQANGVDLKAAITAAEPTTLAIVGLDESGNATYDFYINGTADWQWTAEELAAAPPDEWVHTGSLAAWTSPGAEVISAHLERLRADGTTVISFDPNVRPLLLGDRGDAARRIESLVALSDVVKASAEDLAWLYPDRTIDTVLREWHALGARLVVVTDGANGAHALTESGPVQVPARAIDVVDTVGAGDAFMAGLINALLIHDTLSGDLGSEAVSAVLAEAILVAALTCQRAGANPPTADELAAARAQV